MEITGRAADNICGQRENLYRHYGLTAPEEEIWNRMYNCYSWAYLTCHPEITHKRLKTNTVFSPLYTTNLKNFTVPVYQTDGNAVFIREEIPLNRTYVVEGMVYRSRGDFSAMEKGQHGSELDSFLLLPENLPERIREVAEEVTANKDGYYAKMKALENYLRTSLTYDLNPSPLPEGQDFVDYFLFADKRGYCTAFASAPAVMGRAVGVPTRYVQGFKCRLQILKVSSHCRYQCPRLGRSLYPQYRLDDLEATPVFPTMDSLPRRTHHSGDVTQDLTPHQRAWFQHK